MVLNCGTRLLDMERVVDDMILLIVVYMILVFVVLYFGTRLLDIMNVALFGISFFNIS